MMFHHVGRKIMVLAKVLCALGIILSILLAVMVWVTGSIPLTVTERVPGSVIVQDSETYSVQTTSTVTRVGGALAGFAILIGGTLFSWLSNLTLYGFGRLIDNSSRLVEMKERECRPTPDAK